MDIAETLGAAENGRVGLAGLLHRVELILLKAGLNLVQASAVARVIVDAERDNCTSHGLYRIEGVLRTIKAGKVIPSAVPELSPASVPAIVRVDAKGGFANAAIALGLPQLVTRARACGIAALVINDAVHFSALWPEVEQLAEQGLAGLAMCPSYAVVAPAGGTKPLLGTNPLAFGWPRETASPYVFDFATSAAARGEIELLRQAKKQLPVGWAIDAEGLPTVEPEAALDGAMLSFGGHKGSAIGTMIELLAGAMIGDLTSAEALMLLGTTTLAPMHGELIIAFSPQLFAAGRPGNPLDRAEALFDGIIAQGARLPSQRRFAARVEAECYGIQLSAADLERLDRLLALGLDAV